MAKKTPLIDRQRRLWAHAETIEKAQKNNKPIPAEVSQWLVRALQNIACGMDGDVAFNVVPQKQGVRKDGFLRDMQKKMANGYIAAAKEKTKDAAKSKKTTEAITEISKAIPDTQRSTVRKNWNKLSTDRKPTFSFGKK